MTGGDIMEDFYKGYKEIIGTSSDITDYLNSLNKSDWHVNEYLIMHNTDDGTEREQRWDGTRFVNLRYPPNKVAKAKNALQRCALDMLCNPKITVCAILGLPGSGKSFLGVQAALYAIRQAGTQQGIVSIREPISTGRESGYLPGTLDTKIGFYFKPIEEQLEGKEFELQKLEHAGQFETITPHYIKGRTFTSQFILVEEAEDLTEKQIRLIGTRVGEGSKVVFSGDYKQSEINSTTDNALVKMCGYLKGNPLFSCICLSEDVRSETSKLFANLYF